MQLVNLERNLQQFFNALLANDKFKVKFKVKRDKMQLFWICFGVFAKSEFDDAIKWKIFYKGMNIFEVWYFIRLKGLQSFYVEYGTNIY